MQSISNIVTGDGDLTRPVRGLVNDGVPVEIWAGRKEIAMKYSEIVGENNSVILDDRCGL